jgi:hypothetical protein
MKRKYFMLAMAVFLLFALAFIGCSDSGGGGGNNSNNNNNNDNNNDNGNGDKNLIGGTITGSEIISGAITFSVSQVTGSQSAARSVYSANPQPVSGQIQIGSRIFKLEGFYDPDSSIFTFSGASGSYVVEFYGLAKEGTGMGKLKYKDSSGDWVEEQVTFEFDPSLLVSGTAAASAPGLPAEWTGMWQCWGDDFEGNAQLTEQFGAAQDGHMILTPHGINFWHDLEALIDDLDEGIADSKAAGLDPPSGTWEEFRESFVSGWTILMASFSVLEVEDKGNGIYDVLVLDSISESEYRKLRFQKGTGSYSNELWIIFCSFGDGGDEWDTYTDDIDTARAGNNFAVNRADWDGGDNFRLHVSKKL